MPHSNNHFEISVKALGDSSDNTSATSLAAVILCIVYEFFFGFSTV